MAEKTFVQFQTTMPNCFRPSRTGKEVLLQAVGEEGRLILFYLLVCNVLSAQAMQSADL